MASRLWEAFNCYAVLDVSASASPQEIKTAWRLACRRHHPDLGGSHDAMVRVNAAYEVLSDPITRVSHDLFWKIGGAAPRRPPPPPPPPPPTRPKAEPRRPPGVPPEPAARAREGAPSGEPFGSIRARVRRRIEHEAARIRSDVGARAQKFASDYARSVADARRTVAYSFAGFVCCSAAGFVFKPALLGSVVAAVSFFGHLAGPRVRGERRFVLLPSGGWARRKADEAAHESTQRDVVGLERYFAELASFVELVMRDSTFDDSESQVARRITVAFFLLGYVPLRYPGVERTLEFSDGDDRILVRFRHREGAAVNVTIPQKLAAAMRHSGVSRGYLFCSPGLSGNAAAYAAEHNIRAYTIESMNEWIDRTLAADYAGPDGDILAHLDTLKAFLGGLSRVLPEHHPSQRSRGRRRRHRPWW